MGDGHKRSLIYSRCQNQVTYLQRMSLLHSSWEGFCKTHSGPGLRHVVSLLVHQPLKVLVPIDSFATSMAIMRICYAKSDTNKLPSEEYTFVNANDILLHL